MARETISTFFGSIIGYIDTDSSGDAKATDFYGTILGFYKKGSNVTTDFYGKILYKGNCLSSLIVDKSKGRL